ncbi:peptidylprolyl isomerase [Leptobacterium sp. I13]|uniref:peptidylprolyl isomerase n=1 Tax=Leptobacterium meishanense TaxID=3128904 RepID=UPI0030EF3D0D
MAILEKIRKRSLFLILVIGLALFAFVVSDLFRNGNFSSTKSIIAEVNGESIQRDAFVQQVENISRQYGAGASTIQVVNQVWNQELRKTLLGQQYEELGLSIEKDQIINVVKANPSFASDPTFQNEAGLFDEGKFVEFIADLKANNPLAYQQWTLQEEALINLAKEQMYFNLIRAGVGATIKEGELNYKLENDKVDIKYVQIPYSTIPDSTVTVSKKEIETYINAHKEEFKEEKSRDIQYVFFEEKPSLEDEETVKDAITALLGNSIEYNEATKQNDTVAGFRTTNDVESFVNKHSDVRYDSTFVAKKSLSIVYADSIFNLAIGEVYGPYKDGDAYKLTRMLARRPNGSVKASHILIAYEGATRANPNITRTKAEAEAKAKELLVEARNNKDKFAELARDNSDGPSAPQGGDLGYFQEGVMVPEFNDFVFSNPAESVGFVETEFGYHVIKIDDKEDVIQLATVVQELEPSEKTINELFTTTTKFEIAVADGNFTDVAKENNYSVRPVNKIKAMDENLPGVGNQRAVVQWAFSKDTKVGDVKRFNISNGYIVAQLTDKTEEGVMTPEDASARVLPILRKQKKAAIIKENNTAASLEAFSQANNVQINTASALNMKTPTIVGAGREPKVVGVAFGLQESATSGLIEGENGIYMVQVTKKSSAIALDNYITYAITKKTSNRNSVSSSVFNALREVAEIEDNRSDFY